MTKEKTSKSRVYCLLLYPDCEAHMQALAVIQRSYDYALILHDRDKLENGEMKKSHYHVVVRFTQARWASAICKELGIEENYIEKARSFPNALMYLVHFNDSDKEQYGIDEVKGTLQSRLKQEVSKIDKTEGEKVLELIDYIDSIAEPIPYNELIRYCADNGYFSELRRSAVLWVKALEEHNSKFKESGIYTK